MKPDDFCRTTKHAVVAVGLPAALSPAEANESAWGTRAPLPAARSAGVPVVLDGKIYVAGGRPPHGHDFAVYDPDAEGWTVLPDMPSQRDHLAGAAIGGRIFIAGRRLGPGYRSEASAG